MPQYSDLMKLWFGKSDAVADGYKINQGEGVVVDKSKRIDVGAELPSIPQKPLMGAALPTLLSLVGSHHDVPGVGASSDRQQAFMTWNL